MSLESGAAPGAIPGPASFDELVRDSALPRIEARALLEWVTGRSRTELIAHGDEPARPAQALRFRELAAARRAGQPLAHLLGQREFFGHRFLVDSTTLIPRPETEHLVETALACLDGLVAPAVIDLGTGSGIIAISIALARPDARVWATDRSDAALAVARRNAQALGVTLQLHAGNWWQAIDGADPAPPVFDLVVSNPPYIAADDPHLAQGDLRFEPREALTPGPAGTEAIDRILADAWHHLGPGGWIAFEHGHDQGAAVRSRLEAAGCIAVSTRQDLAGRDRITFGRHAPGGPVSG